MVLRVVGVMMVLLVAAATKPVSRGNLSGEDPQSLLKLWNLDHAFSAVCVIKFTLFFFNDIWLPLTTVECMK